MNTAVNYAKIAQEVSRIAPYPAIVGCGIHLPPDEVSSDHLLEEFDSFNKYNIPTSFLSSKVGINSMRFASPGTLPSELAIKAAEQALDESYADVDDIDMVIFCGITKDQDEPATAHTVCDVLGINANHVYDVTDACYGFNRGMQDASRAIKLGEVRSALIVTGETSSTLSRKLINQMKKGVSKREAKKALGFLTLGDAGGAAILSAANSESGFYRFDHIADSSVRSKCFYRFMENGVAEAEMLTAQLNKEGHRLARKLREAVMSDEEWTAPDYVLTHQTSRRTYNLMVSLGLAPQEKMPTTFPSLGNITSATFPVNFKKLLDSGRVAAGTKIAGLFAGSGLVFGYFDYVI